MRTRICTSTLIVSLSLGTAAWGGRPLTESEIAKDKEKAKQEAAARVADMPAKDELALIPPEAMQGGGMAAEGLPLEMPVPDIELPTADGAENEAPAASPANAPSSPLIALARKVAPSIVALRAWDGYGNELARGCGFFIAPGGAILTDLSVVHPDIADRIEYISGTTGPGETHRITGVWVQDVETGFTVLQSDARNTAFLDTKPATDFSSERQVAIVGLHDENGLSISDARIRADESSSGTGWLTMRGEDSPGEPGSPAIDADGNVVALVALRVPQGKWFNYGIRIDRVADVLGQISVGRTPNPLSTLTAAKLPPIETDQRFMDAYKALQENRTKQGMALLLRLLKPYPRSPELWAMLGLGFSKMGAKDEAANCNRKAVALDPTMGNAWLQLAVNQIDTKPVQPALEALEKAVVERPGDRISWLLLAEQQMLAGKYQEAERSLLDVLKLQGDYAPASFLLGFTKSKMGDMQGAESALRRCVQVDKRHAQAWFLLGLIQAKQGRTTEAVDAYRNVVDIEPKHPSAWRTLALLERKLGHHTESSAAFERHRKLASAR